MIKRFIVWIFTLTALSSCNMNEKDKITFEIDLKIADPVSTKIYSTSRGVLVSTIDTIYSVNILERSSNWKRGSPIPQQVVGLGNNQILLAIEPKLVNLGEDGEKHWEVNYPMSYKSFVHIGASSSYIPGLNKIVEFNTLEGKILKEIELPNNPEINEVFIGIDAEGQIFRFWKDGDDEACITRFNLEGDSIWEVCGLPFNVHGLDNFSLSSSNFFGFTEESTNTYFLFNKADGSIVAKYTYLNWFTPLLIEGDLLLLVSERENLNMYKQGNTSPVWRAPLNDKVSHSPAVARSHIYLPIKQELHIVSLKTGEQQELLKLPVSSASAPVIKKGQLYIMGEDGVFYGLRLNAR